jgi:hypothetical protein
MQKGELTRLTSYCLPRRSALHVSLGSHSPTCRKSDTHVAMLVSSCTVRPGVARPARSAQLPAAGCPASAAVLHARRSLESKLLLRRGGTFQPAGAGGEGSHYRRQQLNLPTTFFLAPPHASTLLATPPLRWSHQHIRACRRVRDVRKKAPKAPAKKVVVHTPFPRRSHSPLPRRPPCANSAANMAQSPTAVSRIGLCGLAVMGQARNGERDVSREPPPLS